MDWTEVEVEIAKQLLHDETLKDMFCSLRNMINFDKHGTISTGTLDATQESP